MVAAGRCAFAHAPVTHGGVAQALADLQVAILECGYAHTRPDYATAVYGVTGHVIDVRNGPPPDARFGAGGAVEEDLAYEYVDLLEHFLKSPPSFLDVLEVDFLHLLEVSDGGHVRRGGGRHDIPPSCVFSSRCCFQKRKNSPHYISSRG